MLRFYGHFAAAYGTFWLSYMLAGVVDQGRVYDWVGLVGVSAFALLYAILRTRRDTTETERLSARVRALEVLRARDVFGDGPAGPR